MNTDLEPWSDDVVAIVGEQPDPLVSTAALADLLGIGPTRLNTLAREGTIPCTGKGRFPLRAATRAYCRHLREAKGKTVSGELQQARIRAATATAEKTELATAKARGELVPVAEVEAAWTTVLRDVRAAMLAIPARVQQRLGHLTAHDVQMIDREVRDALAECSDG